VSDHAQVSRIYPQIALLTHAPNDLTVLHNALLHMPADFPATTGVDLQALEGENRIAELFDPTSGELAGV
jgi:cobaltochelatase CobN